MIQKELDYPAMETVCYSFNIEDIPPSPTQHAEFTISPKQRRSTLRKQRVLSDRNMQSLRLVSEDLRQLRACNSQSRDGTPNRQCGSIPRDLNNNVNIDLNLELEIAQRRRADSGLCSKTATEGSLYEITSSISDWKYSHLERTTLIRSLPERLV